MAIVVLAARLGLAAVFAVAGLTKLRDLDGSRRAIVGFGVPRRLAWLLGTLLPLAELATATALIPHFSAGWGAVAALLLLLAFSAAIAVNLLRGRTPECRCFGQVHSAPVSWRMAARNVALAAAAVAIVAGEGSIAIGAAVALAAVLLSRKAPVPAEGLPVGTRAPEFGALPELLARGKPVLLVFGSRHCGPCLALTPELEVWRREHADRLTIEVLEREDEGIEAVFDAYRMDATPAAILVGPEGTLASDVAPGEEAIRNLVASPFSRSCERERVPRREFMRLAALGVFAVSALIHDPRRAFAALSPRAERPCRPPCGPLTHCFEGECRCNGIDLLDQCGRKCTNFIEDPANCGGCGNDCPPGKRCRCNKFEICAGRKCVNREGDGSCPDPCTKPGTICCNEKCGDPRVSLKHCGGCDKPPCEGKNPRCCFGTCRDIASDPMYCGGCKLPDRKLCKPPTPVCYAGKCRKECPKGLTPCGSTCYNARLVKDPRTKEKVPIEVCCNNKRVRSWVDDLQFDPNNCGRCGNVCGATVPPAPDNFRCCGGKCANIQLSNEHCDGCFQPCPKGSFCRFGTCTKGA